MAKSEKQLEEAFTKAKEIEETFIRETPALRLNSYAGAMEEYAEAKLFHHWLLNKEILLPGRFVPTMHAYSTHKVLIWIQ
jgi:hypothetical protein